MNYYLIPLYLLFALLPSLIWLFYYLKKDLHPEPKKIILKVFLCGGLSTIPTYFIQIGLLQIVNKLQISPFFNAYPLILEIIIWFFVIALTEELCKYVVVRITVFKSYALDEPLDIMLYMVVAALGFAAAENMIYLGASLFTLPATTPFATLLQTTIIISFLRFIGAVFLHTLCSGLLGYFVALSLVRNKKRISLTIVGIFLAALLHGSFDFSIMTLNTPFNFLVPGVILLGLAIFMLYDFNEIKKIKGICKLN